MFLDNESNKLIEFLFYVELSNSYVSKMWKIISLFLFELYIYILIKLFLFL
jgi:hypothetical protein